MVPAKSYYWPPDFDPAATYQVAAWPLGFTVRGKQPKRGEIFDKTNVPANMLRAHYEARWLVMVDPAETAEIIPEIIPAAPESSKISEVIAEAIPHVEAAAEMDPPKIKRSRAGGKVV